MKPIVYKTFEEFNAQSEGCKICRKKIQIDEQNNQANFYVPAHNRISKADHRYDLMEGSGLGELWLGNQKRCRTWNHQLVVWDQFCTFQFPFQLLRFDRLRKTDCRILPKFCSRVENNEHRKEKRQTQVETRKYYVANVQSQQDRGKRFVVFKGGHIEATWQCSLNIPHFTLQAIGCPKCDKLRDISSRQKLWLPQKSRLATLCHARNSHFHSSGYQTITSSKKTNRGQPFIFIFNFFFKWHHILFA